MKLKENRLVNYLLTARDELKKVTWPTQKEVIKYTLIVLGMTAAVFIYFAILDYGFTILLELIIS